MQLVKYVNTTLSYVPRHRSYIHVHFTTWIRVSQHISLMDQSDIKY